MVTPQPTEMQVEGEIGVEEAVKEMLEIEVEADEGDPFEGMNNTEVAEIYYKMKPEDRHLFRQFKSFHKLHYETHGHDAPSNHLAKGIIQEMFSGLASKGCGDHCKCTGRAVGCRAIPTQLQSYRAPEAPEYPPPPLPLCFPSRQEREKQRAAEEQAK